MIRNYVGTVVGEILATYQRDNEKLDVVVSNHYWCAVFRHPETSVDVVYFSSIPEEIEEFIEKQKLNGYSEV